MTFRFHISSVWHTLTVLLLLVVSSCSNGKVKVLSENQMVDLMVDLELAEAYNNMAVYEEGHQLNKKELAESVLKQHGVTLEQLDTTLAWYGKNLDKYQEVYDKAIAKIDKRKAAIKVDEISTESVGDNLWSYGKNGMVSKFGISDGYILSIPDPEIEKGDVLEWTFHVNTMPSVAGVLGVEYEDGTGENATSSYIRNNKFSVKLFTDTAKVARRIYGSIRFGDRNQFPIFIDSLTLIKTPYDSLINSQFNPQRKYDSPHNKNLTSSNSNEEKVDSIKIKFNNQSHNGLVYAEEEELTPEAEPATVKGTSSKPVGRPGVQKVRDRNTNSTHPVRPARPTSIHPAKGARPIPQKPVSATEAQAVEVTESAK